MDNRVQLAAAILLTVGLFLGVQLGALLLVEPLSESDRQAVENPDDPTNSLVFFGVIVLATALMLGLFRYDADRVVRGLIVGVSVMLSWFVFVEALPAVITVGETNVLAVVAALSVGVGLVVHPEWYVIDTAGVLIGAGAAGLFGISISLLPVLVFLVVLAVYDAISVYKTKHMLSLADGVMDLKIPVVFVVPTSLSYSYLDDPHRPDGGDEESAPPKADAESSAREAPESVGHGDAMFVGLGDAVIPAILVASAAHFLDAGAIDVALITLNAAALGAMIGTLVGLLILMYLVLKGRPHAGLPLLNTGAIGGYLIGAVASGVSLATALGL